MQILTHFLIHIFFCDYFGCKLWLCWIHVKDRFELWSTGICSGCAFDYISSTGLWFRPAACTVFDFEQGVCWILFWCLILLIDQLIIEAFSLSQAISTALICRIYKPQKIHFHIKKDNRRHGPKSKPFNSFFDSRCESVSQELQCFFLTSRPAATWLSPNAKTMKTSSLVGSF